MTIIKTNKNLSKEQEEILFNESNSRPDNSKLLIFDFSKTFINNNLS